MYNPYHGLTERGSLKFHKLFGNHVHFQLRYLSNLIIICNRERDNQGMRDKVNGMGNVRSIFYCLIESTVDTC